MKRGLPMTYKEAQKLLSEIGQSHVLSFWGDLTAGERKALLAQIGTFDAASLNRCRQALSMPEAEESNSTKAGKAPKVAQLKGPVKEKCVAKGEAELRAGRVAVLLVAGGQGSRLGFEGPKGAYPIGPLTGKPLFNYHARKILALSQKFSKPLPWYIMTSEANDAVTKKCFVANKYFGLDPKNIMFFTQGMWPGMLSDGKVIMQSKSRVFMSPDGHGGLLAALSRSGALEDMKRRGIKHVFFFQVDNPLVEIADPAFIGYHAIEKSEFTLKLCAKRDPFEKVGVPMLFGNSYRMVEYTEMSKEQCLKKRADGNLYHLYGSPAIHVFDRAFLEREAGQDMPLHLAFKKIPTIDSKGETIKPSEPNGYKFEKFIFDLLPKARKAAFLAFNQEDEFSPLKNADGDDSPKTCKRDMMAKWRRVLAEKGVDIAQDAVFELDPVKFIK